MPGLMMQSLESGNPVSYIDHIQLIMYYIWL